MLLSTGLCLVAINASRRVFQHGVAMQRWLAGPWGSLLGTAPALTIGSVRAAAGRQGPMQLAVEGGSVVCMDQLVHALVDKI